MIRVLIADDQAMVRSGLRSLLEDEPDMSVVAEAADGAGAVAATRAHHPDVVLMDIRMPHVDGLTAIRELAHVSTARMLVLTTFDLDEYVFEALRAGASGLLLKDATAQELVAAVRSVAAGEALLDPAVTRRVIEAFASRPPLDPARQHILSQLTEREREVLRLVARGCSNAEIAQELHISTATAKTHVSNVLTKLGSRDRTQAVIHAYESGLVTPGTA